MSIIILIFNTAIKIGTYASAKTTKIFKSIYPLKAVKTFSPRRVFQVPWILHEKANWNILITQKTKIIQNQASATVKLKNNMKDKKIKVIN